MTAGGEQTCQRCGGDTWVSDRYCGACGIELTGTASSAGYSVSSPGEPSTQVFGDTSSDDGSGHGRLLIGGLLVALACVVAGALALTRGEPAPDETLDEVAAQPTPTGEPTAQPAVEPTGPVEDPPPTADFTLARDTFLSHDLGQGLIAIADGQEAKLIDLATGEVTTLFDDVNFFEIVAVGERGLTAAVGYHQAEMVGPGALRYFPFERDPANPDDRSTVAGSIVVGSLSSYLGGNDVVYTRHDSGDEGAESNPVLNLFDPASGETKLVRIPAGSTWTIRGDSVFAQSGSEIVRMGADLDDWASVGTGSIEPIPGDTLLAFNCATGAAGTWDPCSVDVYLDDGTLGVSHNRSSPLIQSGVLFAAGLTRKMSTRGTRVLQLVNGGGGGIWDIEAGLLTTLLASPVTQATWLPDDSGLIGMTADDTQLKYISATSGSSSELGVDLGRFLLLAVRSAGGQQS